MAPKSKISRAWLERVRALVTAHHELVYRVAYRVTHNRADAEDIAQSVFVKLLLDERALDGVASERAWVAQVTINAANTELRSLKRRRGREREWLTRRLERKSGSETGDDMEERETRKLIDDAIASLPDDLRVPMVLHYQEGFKYREIADACGCPEGTVARRISRAKAKLRERLARNGALAAFPGLEEALRAATPIPCPPGLEANLLQGVETAWAGLGAGAAGTATASSSAATASSVAAGSFGAVAKVAAAFVLSGTIATVTWFAMEAKTRSATDSSSGARSETTALDGRRNTIGDEPRLDSGRRARPRRSTHDSEPAEGRDDADGEDVIAEETPAPAVIRGRVVDSTGQPVADALVSLMDTSLKSPEATVPCDPDGYYEITASVGARALWELTATAANSFSPDGKLLMTAPAGGAGEEQVWDAATGKRIETLAKAQAEAEMLAERARVIQEENAENAKLVLEELVATQAEASRQLEESRAAQVDLGGTTEALNRAQTFSFDGSVSKTYARGGQRRVLVLADGFEPAYSKPFDQDLTEDRVIDFRLEPSRQLSGNVFSETGHALGDAQVRILGYLGGAPFPADTDIVRTDDEGAFSFPTLAPGTYAIEVSAQGHVPVERVVHASESRVVVQLPLAGSARVRVLRRGTREPIIGYLVELRDASDGFVLANGVTDADGVAEIDPIAPGRYFLNTYRVKSDSRISRGWSEILVRSGQAVDAEIVVAHRVDLLGTAPGAIEDPSNARAKELRLIATRRDLPWQAKSPGADRGRTANLNALGAFRLRSLPPGVYELRLEQRGNLVAKLEVELFADMPETVVELDVHANASGVPERANEPETTARSPETRKPVYDLQSFFEADAEVTVITRMHLSTYLDLVASLQTSRITVGDGVTAIDLERASAQSRGAASPAKGLAQALREAELGVYARGGEMRIERGGW